MKKQEIKERINTLNLAIQDSSERAQGEPRTTQYYKDQENKRYVWEQEKLKLEKELFKRNR